MIIMNHDDDDDDVDVDVLFEISWTMHTWDMMYYYTLMCTNIIIHDLESFKQN